MSDQDEDVPAPLEPRIAAAVVDVLVYVVVLNLFVEYFPRVLSETFTLSLLTAALLKGILEVVVAAKNRIKARFKAASTPIGKVTAAAMLWVVLFGSKFLVPEAIDLVFGDRVSLGGFFSVTLLILTLLLSRRPFSACSKPPVPCIGPDKARIERPEEPVRIAGRVPVAASTVHQLTRAATFCLVCSRVTASATNRSADMYAPARVSWCMSM
ncbi:hypothetical protein [Actinophytocola sp.]|uniref:hypothetical protein n=1 Tax=Actinophytocola sp. TaxID=1872138 RepID=UPI0025BE3E2A|nr:hypothetical protein [Actinophytocola sp.]